MAKVSYDLTIRSLM